MDEKAELTAENIASPEKEYAEKMLTQQQVNDIVRREKLQAAEKARREAEAEFGQRQMQAPQEMAQQGQPYDAKSIKEDVYNQFLDDLQREQQRAQQEAHERHLEQVAEKYYLKMGKKSEMFEDFDQIVADFEPDKFPNVVMMAAQMENTPEIMYELAKNPTKLMMINAMSKESPKMAQKQMQLLSESIGKNLEAKNTNQTAPAPLSKVQSSSTAGVDSGKPMTVQDYRSMDWLRG